MTTQIAIRLTEADMSALDEVVARGRFRNRSSALRRGLELLLREEREREIEEAYRRGYGKHPQEEWVGNVGLAALSDFVAAEDRDTEPL